MARPLSCSEVADELGMDVSTFYRERAALEQLGLTPIPRPAIAKPGGGVRKRRRMYAREVVQAFKLGLAGARPIAGFVPANANDHVAQRLKARAQALAAGDD